MEHRGSRLVLSHKDLGSCQCPFLQRQKLSDRGGGQGWAAAPGARDGRCRTRRRASRWGMVRRKKRCSDCHSEALATAMFACMFSIRCCCVPTSISVAWSGQARLHSAVTRPSPVPSQIRPIPFFTSPLAMMPSSWSQSSCISSLPFPFLASGRSPAPEL